MDTSCSNSLKPSRRKIAEQIARISLPAVVTNISVPLLSIVDTAIVGHMGAQKYIGAVAVGGVIFNVLYWVFAFLRMGTSGLTSQAFGRGDRRDIALQLSRPLALAAVFGLLLVALGGVAADVAFAFISASDDVEPLAREFSGWFLGMQNSRYPMVVAITQNLVNIAASLFFVYVLGFGIKGVALGMVTAQYTGLAMCVALWRIKYASGLPRPEWAEVFDVRGMSRFFSVNKDIFLRTVCIVFVMSYFTSAGAAMNDTVLAVNALLMQLFIIFSYFMDGFAYAGEALVGRYVGERNRPAFSMVVRQLLYVGAALAVVFTLFYFAGGRGFLSMLTDDNATVSAAMVYLPWAACVPVVSFGAFVLDGVCIGATASRVMLLSSFLAAVVFFNMFILLRGMAGNNALWAAFLAYLAVRTLVNAAFYGRLVRHTFVLPQKSGT